MKRIAAIVMLLAGLFAGTAAQAGPGDDCLAVRQSGNDALNAHDVNRIMSHYFRDVIYFSSAQNELIVGTDMLRAFFTKLPTTVKVEMGQVLATQGAQRHRLFGIPDGRHPQPKNPDAHQHDTRQHQWRVADHRTARVRVSQPAVTERVIP
jgi:hypothetical protein